MPQAQLQQPLPRPLPRMPGPARPPAAPRQRRGPAQRATAAVGAAGGWARLLPGRCCCRCCLQQRRQRGGGGRVPGTLHAGHSGEWQVGDTAAAAAAVAARGGGSAACKAACQHLGANQAPSNVQHRRWWLPEAALAGATRVEEDMAQGDMAQRSACLRSLCYKPTTQLGGQAVANPPTGLLAPGAFPAARRCRAPRSAVDVPLGSPIDTCRCCTAE